MKLIRWKIPLDRFQKALIVITTIVFLLSVLIFPFLIERQSESWVVRTNRQDDPERELNLFEHYYQFNLDISHWINLTRQFPGYYREHPTRINRPIYPALGSILPRLITVITKLPDVKAGLAEPASLRITFLSLLLVNYISLLGCVLLFYAWLGNYFSQPVSMLAVLMLLLSHQVFIDALQPADHIIAYFIIIATIYLFDIILLAPENPTWKQITGVSMLLGIFMLTKMHYDVLIFGWLSALVHRRWKVLFGTLILHLVPLIIWIIILRIFGMTYYNHEMAQYDQAVWFIQMVQDGQLLNIYPLITSHISGMLQSFIPEYSLVILLLVMWSSYSNTSEVPKNFQSNALLLITSVVIFSVGVNYYTDKFLKDMFPAVLPLASAGLFDLTRKLAEWFRLGNTTTVQLVFILFVLLINLLLSWGYMYYGGGFAWHADFALWKDLFARLARPLVETGPAQ